MNLCVVNYYEKNNRFPLSLFSLSMGYPLPDKDQKQIQSLSKLS